MNYKQYKDTDYMVSIDGEIISTKFNKIKILKQQNHNKGYKLVGLQYDVNKGKRGKLFLVHRIVAETYIPNPLNLAEINHKDGNKQNNKVSNLEWTTHKENMIHAVKNNLHNPTAGFKGRKHSIESKIKMKNINRERNIKTGRYEKSI